jgi:DnaK suppressor protein
MFSGLEQPVVAGRNNDSVNVAARIEEAPIDGGDVKRYGGPMDPERARELLQAERERIERALARVQPEDDGEPADEYDPANLASDLYQDELDETFADDLHEQLAALERAEARLAAGTYGLSVDSGERIPDARLEARPAAERTADEERARTDR